MSSVFHRDFDALESVRSYAWGMNSESWLEKVFSKEYLENGLGETWQDETYYTLSYGMLLQMPLLDFFEVIKDDPTFRSLLN